MGMIRGGALILALAASAFAAEAGGTLTSTTEYRQHKVVGSTPAELWRYIITHPIIDPDDGPAIANITHDHTLTFKTASAGGACRVTDLRFRWNFVITLPVADESRMSAATRTMWRDFTAYLKTHEEKHRAIFLDCGKKFVPAAAALKGLPGCLGMNAKVRRMVDTEYQACMKKQRAFDQTAKVETKALALVRAATGKTSGGPGF
jgi:predicted secreted Zn-dependent protease